MATTPEMMPMVVDFIRALIDAQGAASQSARVSAHDRIADVSQVLLGRMRDWDELFTEDVVKTDVAPVRKLLLLYTEKPERALDFPTECALGEDCGGVPDESESPVGFTVARLWAATAERAEQARGRRTVRRAVTGFSIALAVVSAGAAGVVAWRGRDRVKGEEGDDGQDT